MFWYSLIQFDGVHVLYTHLSLIIGTTPNCIDGDIRLIGGDGDNDGRVEICYHGYWGLVCADHWDDSDARVACRQLGFPPLGMVQFWLKLMS